jgi:putrescine transport system ATP-binding protein
LFLAKRLQLTKRKDGFIMTEAATVKSLGSIRRSFAPWNDPAAKPYVSFKNITKRFGDFVAVDNLSLDIFNREFFALLGASGCGKSTLLRMLAGFETPTEGQIILDGVDMTGIPPHKRPVNMMFQSYALFPHMTVANNIAFGLKQEGMAQSEIDDRVASMLKLVKLDQFSKRKPHQLSGGQRQRVALARSVAKRPKLLLLDEPLGALDKKLREETQFELTDLQMELGLTFIVVTHDQEEAMTMADRMAVMDKGRIIQVGTPTETYEAPNSKYIADFIGTINLFEGEVTKAANGNVEIAGKAGFVITAENGGNAAKGNIVWFGVRPEKMRISSTKPKNTATNAVEGEVWEIGYLGDVTTFHVKLADGMIAKVATLNAARTSAEQLTWGDRAWISFSADAGIVLTK